MPLLGVVLVLIVIGVLLWALESLVPMDPWFKKAIRVVVILVVVLWLIGLVLGYNPLTTIRIGR